MFETEVKEFGRLNQTIWTTGASHRRFALTIQIHKYKYTHTITQIQIHKYTRLVQTKTEELVVDSLVSDQSSLHCKLLYCGGTAQEYFKTELQNFDNAMQFRIVHCIKCNAIPTNLWWTPSEFQIKVQLKSSLAAML